MRRPRDYDAEMKLLAHKAKALQERKLRELGQLVTATGADSLGVDVLAGVLVNAIASTDMMQKDEWRTDGAAFFLRGKLATSATKDGKGGEKASRSPAPAAGVAGAG